MTFWPTIVASEARQGFQDRSRGKKGAQESLTTVACKTLDDRGGLNPDFAAWLMGFPFEWTECAP